MLTPPSRPHEHRLRPRYAETDQMGRVHHANFLLYMEDGRTRMMDELGCSYAELEREGWALVVRGASLRYRAAAFYDEELVVRTWIERLGRASVEFGYQIVRGADGALLVEGTTDLGCVLLGADPPRPSALPARVREALGREPG